MAAKERSVAKERNAVVEGTTLSLTVIMGLALFVMINYLSSRHYKRFDWTESKLYTLSEKSENVVRGLDREIEATIFMSPDSELYGAADELLSRYAAVNPGSFKKRIVDPVRDPLEARRLAADLSTTGGVVVLTSGDDRRVIEEYEMAEYDFSGAKYGQGPTMKEFKGEQLITSSILELVEAEKPRILFTTGHGEAPLNEARSFRSMVQARDILGQDNFELEEWDSAGQAVVPDGTDLLVIAGPQTPFFEQELEVFSNYLDAGGRMLVLLDPALRQETLEWIDLGLENWLKRYGVDVGSNLVIDPGTQLPLYGPEVVMVEEYGSHPIVDDLEQTRTRVLFKISRTVGKAEDAAGRFNVTELLRTSSQAWGETNLDQEGGDLVRDEGEIGGSLALGVAVSFTPREGAAVDVAADDIADTAGTDTAEDQVALFEPEEDAGDTGETTEDGEKNEARLVVYGDLDFAAEDISSLNNAYLLLNSFNWLVQREQLISIEGRKPEETKLFMSESEQFSVILLVMLLMPGMAVIAGISVFMRRRR